MQQSEQAQALGQPSHLPSWSGLAKQRQKPTSREWLGVAGIGVASTLLAVGVGWLINTKVGLAVGAGGYGLLLTVAIGLASRVGAEKPIALDQHGLWFEGSLLYPRASIQRFNLLMTSQGASRSGVTVREFAGGIEVLATTGKTWFELSVPPELTNLARALGIDVVDAPKPRG